jgi:hypothetical protein
MIPESNPKPMEVVRAAEDIRRRTLSTVKDPLDQLIYLASMRDYNTGLYHHAGLSMRFGDDVACEALAQCHRDAYWHLIASPIRSVVEQLEAYAVRSGTTAAEMIATWKELEPYRVAVPSQSDPLATDFVASNVSIALSILESRLPGPRPKGSGASPRPSPVQ